MSATQTVDLGRDPSGRTIRLTRRMKAAFDATAEACGFVPTILQGAFMAQLGGGAQASAGYHDRSGCIDTRTRDLTVVQQERLLRCARSVGWAVWRRDQAHGGMDEHMHWVLLGEPDMAPGARQQEADYRAGYDGLTPRGRDYHWRPTTIRSFDYDRYLEEDMPTMKELKEELVPAIVNQIMRRDLNRTGMTVADALRQASRADDVQRLLERLPAEVAKAAEESLPAGEERLTRAQVRLAAQRGAEAALKRLLVDGVET
ncbi:MAG TPA: hypothetical protein VFZ64_13480 [Nocardioidaceae bacterium]